MCGVTPLTALRMAEPPMTMPLCGTDGGQAEDRGGSGRSAAGRASRRGAAARPQRMVRDAARAAEARRGRGVAWQQGK